MIKIRGIVAQGTSNIKMYRWCTQVVNKHAVAAADRRYRLCDAYIYYSAFHNSAPLLR